MSPPLKEGWRLVCKDKKTGEVLWRGHIVGNEKGIRDICEFYNKTDAIHGKEYEVETLTAKDIENERKAKSRKPPRNKSDKAPKTDSK